MKPVARAFFARPVVEVARDLLGCVLVHETRDGRTSGMIVEAEAYIGEDDPACHAAPGPTDRNEPLYGEPGMAYVYFIYGVHWCFNAVTREEGSPSAVLVRALEPLDGLPLMQRRRPGIASDVGLTNGPGKLCKALGITGDLNRKPLQRKPLVVREGDRVSDKDVEVTPRIGITKSADWPLRYIVRANKYVSRGKVSA